jgi:UDP-N-acetylmuramoylalanine--D-glutamate ligase
MNVKNLNIVVIGGARSGLAAARLLISKGAKVLLTDSGTLSDAVKSAMNASGIEWEENGHSDRAMQADFAVTSPGVPDTAPIIRHYMERGCQVYSELEAASWFTSSPIVAITGSNGKTTVTSWLDHLWQTASVPHFTAGNIGTAFSEVVTKMTGSDWALVEVSSFQLDHIRHFRPRISCILNITPDHLDRYQNDFNKYASSKMRIIENQTNDDVFICRMEDTVVNRFLSTLSSDAPKPRIWRFSDENRVDEGIYVRQNDIIFNIDNKEEFLMHVSEIGLQGRHNLHNGLATALAARAAEIRLEHIRESLMKFEGVEHRLETVRQLNGVRYVNDSKATNVNAVWYALESMKVPLVLIMGGRDKGNDYSEIIPLLRDKVHTIVAIGEARQALKSQLAEAVPEFVEADSMTDAVKIAFRKAKRGETVLLSPACASFDMFENYEHRGREFKRAVNNLD